MSSLLDDDAASPPEPGSAPAHVDPDAVRILIVDDDEDDYLITRDMLADQRVMACTVDWEHGFSEALAEIRRQRHDVYLVDYHLGERTGLELIREGFASRPFAPVIMLTGQPTYEVSLEATALGVTDFLVKQQLGPTLLERAIRHSISHQKAERYALAARAADDGIWDWDMRTGSVYLSPRWHTILGRPAEAGEAPPSDLFALVEPEDRPRLQEAIDDHLSGRTPNLVCEHRMLHRDGSWRWVMTRGVATRDADGTPTRLAGSTSDMTDRHIEQLRLEHEALHDKLTGLPNRTLFIDRVEQTLQRARRDRAAGCAVLFMDLDGFKDVNDSLSHAIGDQLLIAFAERLTSALRPGDTVARLGGDEFTVLAEKLTEPSEATAIADRILISLQTPFEVAGHELSVGASIGISLSTPELTPTELISTADLAMYDAKRQGRGRWAVFDELMHRRVLERRARQNEVREVVEGGLLRVNYQPIIDLDTGRVAGLEALARWPHGRPQLEPIEFIAIAEQTGLIGALGTHVMRTALADLRRWQDAGLASADLWVSVNLSPRQLADPMLVSQVRDAVAQAGLGQDRLRLETVEDTLLRLERSDRMLSDLVRAGIGLHIDDFGSGYSSLSALHRLPIKGLKLDRKLVSDLDDDGARGLVRSVVAVAASLQAAAIASGVESAEQRDALAALGCSAAQGMHLAPVLDTDGIELMLGGV